VGISQYAYFSGDHNSVKQILSAEFSFLLFYLSFVLVAAKVCQGNMKKDLENLGPDMESFLFRAQSRRR
jgi:hypothetical protein